MAGGKETPRQKMVGMMYLVLTALLALQVSNAILDKFVFIDESLNYSIDVARKATDTQLKGAEQLVEKSGSKASDKAILAKAETVKKQTEDIFSAIDKMRNDLITMSGGVDPKNPKSYVGAKNDAEVMTYMIGVEGGAKGKAYDLQKMLNSYGDDLGKIDTSLRNLSEKIAFDGKDIPMYKNDEEQRIKDFANVTFGQTPLVAALAVLSDLKAKVAQKESKAIEHLTAQIGEVPIKFDVILAMASAESKVVAAGTKYKAKMFIAASSSQIKPKMTSSQGGVKVNGNVGEVEFTAPSASDYNEQGLAKRKWQGAITIPSKNGDTTFRFDEEYFIAKPVIKVQSGNVSALYLNCGNDLQVDVPALGASYDPSFTATGAEVIRSGDKGKITVVPNAANVELSVSSGGSKIGTEKFKVKLLPKPDLKVLNNGKPIDEKQGGACPRLLKAVATAEASVKEAIPKDARYKVTEWEITLARGRKGVKVQKFTSDEANMSEFAQQAREGDRLVIEIKGAMRMNFKNATEKVGGVSGVIFQYPITQ